MSVPMLSSSLHEAPWRIHTIQCSILLTSLVHRKKEQLQRKKSQRSNLRLRPQKPLNRNGEKLRKHNARPRKRQQSKPRRKLQNYSSLYKCKKCLSVSTQRPSFVSSINMEIARKVVIDGDHN